MLLLLEGTTSGCGRRASYDPLKALLGALRLRTLLLRALRLGTLLLGTLRLGAMMLGALLIGHIRLVMVVWCGSAICARMSVSRSRWARRS